MIEVGEYIRTNTGLIDKVIKYITEDDTFPHDAFDYMGEFVAYSKDEITKHSKDIIDLIEVGDFVNGYPVMEPVYNGNVWYGVDEGYEQFKRAFGKIKTILTHEMYEQNCYKVGEENE